MSARIPYTVRTSGPVHIGGRTVPRGFLFDEGNVERPEDLHIVRASYTTLHKRLVVLAPGEALPEPEPRAASEEIPAESASANSSTSALESKETPKRRRKNTDKDHA